MESEFNYDEVFWLPPGIDYKQVTARIKPVEYVGMNYIVQAQNLDKTLAAKLLPKVLADVNWDEVTEEPISLTTADFKIMLLSLNAQLLQDMENDDA